jgi:hypothetical protein
MTWDFLFLFRIRILGRMALPYHVRSFVGSEQNIFVMTGQHNTQGVQGERDVDDGIRNNILAGSGSPMTAVFLAFGFFL